jgi:signal transduction histidine kinase
LVQNAIEAPGSTPTVRLDVSGDRYSVMVGVVDHGNGIAAAAREQLFRPFFTTKNNGTGLGLASSRAIVEAHEGTIGFDDVNGGGTRFWFRLPADAQANDT